MRRAGLRLFQAFRSRLRAQLPGCVSSKPAAAQQDGAPSRPRILKECGRLALKAQRQAVLLHPERYRLKQQEPPEGGSFRPLNVWQQRALVPSNLQQLYVLLG